LMVPLPLSYNRFATDCAKEVISAAVPLEEGLSVSQPTKAIRPGFAPGFVIYKKGAFDSQAQVIMPTSCLPMIGGSLRVLRLPPPLFIFKSQ
jgi:hypothetical protein